MNNKAHIKRIIPTIKYALSYLRHIFGWMSKMLLKIVTGNTLLQFFLLAVAFCIVFMTLRSIFDFSTGELFKFMTSFDDKRETSFRSLGEILYLTGVIFFSGFLVAVLTNGFRNRINKFELGDVRLSFRNHILIFGYNDVALGIIKDSLNEMKSSKRIIGRDIVVVVGNNVTQVREDIKGKIGSHSNVYVMHNNGLNKDDIKSFHPSHAHVVYIVGSQAEDVNSDLENLNLLMDLRTILFDSTNKNLTTVNIYLNNPSSSLYLIDFHNYSFFTEKGINVNIRNTIERWARRIIIDTQNEWPSNKIARRRSNPLDPTTPEMSHIIIFGMNKIGETVAVTAAKLCHFANFITKGVKTKITVIDKDFGWNRGLLSGLYSDFMELCEYEVKVSDEKGLRSVKKNEIDNNLTDIKWEFIESIPDNEFLSQHIETACNEQNSTVSIVVCGDNEAENYELAFNLPKVIYDNDIPIWLYSKVDQKMNSFLRGTMYSNIIPWGIDSVDTIKEMPEEKLAKLFNYFHSVVCEEKSRRKILDRHNDQNQDINIRDFILLHEIDWKKVDKEWNIRKIRPKDTMYDFMSFYFGILGHGIKFPLSDKEKEIVLNLDNINAYMCMLIKGVRLTNQYKGNDESIKSDRYIKYINLISDFITSYDFLSDDVKKSRKFAMEIILSVTEKYRREEHVVEKTEAHISAYKSYIDRKKYCKLYKGEDKNPYEHYAILDMFWDYEAYWAMNNETEEYSDMLKDYLSNGLKTFYEEDGTPISLKALMWTRFSNVHVLSEDGKWVKKKLDAEQFREWYEVAMKEIAMVNYHSNNNLE